MPIKRTRAEIQPKSEIWIKQGHLFLADFNKLKAALNQFPVSKDSLKLIMGPGYKHLIDACNGKLLDASAAILVEAGFDWNKINREPKISKLLKDFNLNRKKDE